MAYREICIIFIHSYCHHFELVNPFAISEKAKNKQLKKERKGSKPNTVEALSDDEINISKRKTSWDF